MVYTWVIQKKKKNQNLSNTFKKKFIYFYNKWCIWLFAGDDPQIISCWCWRRFPRATFWRRFSVVCSPWAGPRGLIPWSVFEHSVEKKTIIIKIQKTERRGDRKSALSKEKNIRTVRYQCAFSVLTSKTEAYRKIPAGEKEWWCATRGEISVWNVQTEIRDRHSPRYD